MFVSTLMKNVLFLLTRYPGIGGIEKITTVLVNELVSRYGIVICSHAQEQEEMLLSDLDKHINFCRLPHSQSRDENITFLLNTIEEYCIDIVVYQDSYFGNEYLPEAVSKRTDAKVIVVEHNSPNNPNLSLISYFQENCWYKKMYTTCKTLFYYGLSVFRGSKRRTLLYDCSDSYVLLSRSLIPHFQRFSCVGNLDKLVVIENPVSYRNASQAGGEKKKQVLFVAQLIRRKGITRLLNIWSQVELQFPDWELLIAGDGELMDSTKEFIRRHELKNVNLLGFVHPVTPYYADAQILCLCSSFEGYPMVLPEAMRSGVIPIAFNSFPALTDIVDDGKNGYVIPPFDEGVFVNKLKSLMSDDEARQQMREAAVQKSATFDIDTAVEKWAQLFESLGA